MSKLTIVNASHGPCACEGCETIRAQMRGAKTTADDRVQIKSYYTRSEREALKAASGGESVSALQARIVREWLAQQ